jgi:hypothetical protein
MYDTNIYYNLLFSHRFPLYNMLQEHWPFDRHLPLFKHGVVLHKRLVDELTVFLFKISNYKLNKIIFKVLPLEARIFWFCEVDGCIVEINNEEVATALIPATETIKLALVVVRIGRETSIKIDKSKSENKKQKSSLVLQKEEQLSASLHVEHELRFIFKFKQSIHFLFLEFQVQQTL